MAIERREKAIFGECDCCTQNRWLVRRWYMGIETFACAPCCSCEPDEFDEEEPEPPRNDCPSEAEIERSQSLLAAVLGELDAEVARREADDRRFADEVAAAVARNVARCYEHRLRQSQEQADCQADHDEERQHGWTIKEGE